MSPDQYNLAKCLPLNALKPDYTCNQDEFLTLFEEGAHDTNKLIRFYKKFINLKSKKDIKEEKDDDTPTNVVKDDILIVEKGGQTMFYPFKEIFIRKCYPKLKELALNASETTSVAIIGDPGIGKTTLIRYMFHLLVKENIKVYWAFESGMWRYFDGPNSGNPKTGTEPNDSWMQEEVILLVDGSYQEKFMSKLKKMILFCSPERSNYAKMIKFHQGRVFVMPPWSYNEVKELLNSKGDGSEENCGLKLFKKFYEEVVADAEKSAEFPENISSEVSDFFARNQNLDENDTKKGLILSWLEARYNLVGGRIRLLLDNNLRYEELRDRVETAVLCVSPKKLSRINALDYFTNVPSILYSLISDEKTNFRRYSIRFASDSIRDLVFGSIITGKSEDFKSIFGAMKAHNIAGSLMGQIFESTLHKYITQKLYAEFICRKLVASDNSNSMSSTDKEDEKLIMSNFETLYYDAAKPGDLKKIIENSGKNIFLIPKQSNSAQVDSIYYNCEKKQIYFFQITTALRHSFRFHVIRQLAQAIGFDVGSVRFVFIVPESIFHSFSYQYYMTKTNQPYQDQNKLESQLVASFSNIDDINNYFIKIQTEAANNPVKLELSEQKSVSDVIKEEEKEKIEYMRKEEGKTDMTDTEDEDEEDGKEPIEQNYHKRAKVNPKSKN